jgi:Nucleoside 2-deoxyribosyltransferase
MNKQDRIYIAGSLFNEAEINQRKSEERLLRSLGFENIFNPINAPCNKKDDLPTAEDIFLGDTLQILRSDKVIADISNQIDAGVFCELGIIWMCNYIHHLVNTGLSLKEILKTIPRKEVIAHLSDIRKATAHNYQGNHIPVAFNQFMIGMVEDMGVIKDNFQEVLDEVEK